MAVKETSVMEIFEEMGIDFDSDDLMSDEGSSGFSSLYEIENPTSALRPIPLDFGKNTTMVIPLYLAIPFNPQTGEKLPRGKYFSTANKEITPDDVIRLICLNCEKDPEYDEKIKRILNTKTKQFNIGFDRATGALNEGAYEAFLPYVNPFSVSGKTQRYKINEERTITRKAIMPTNEYNAVLFDQVDPKIAVRYRIESLLMAEEIKIRKAELVAENVTKKKIESEIKEIRGNKAVTPPRVTNALIAFAFDADSSGALTTDEMSRYNDTSIPLEGTLMYFTPSQTNVKSIMNITKRENYDTLNYIVCLRSVPVKNDEVPNLGVAASKMTFSSLGSKTQPSKQIPEFNQRIETVLRNKNIISADRIKKSVNKFGDISVEDVVECYSNGFSAYKRALSDKAFIANNIALLSEVKSDLGLTQIMEASLANREVIDVAEVTKEFVDENELEEYLDSDDINADTSTEATAEDFV